VNRIAYDFLSLFFPNICCLCGETRVFGEPEICSLCLVSMPRELNYDGYRNNTVSRLQGMLKFEQAYSFLRFRKNSRVQSLLHQVKYQGKANLGIQLGKWFAAEILYNIRNDFELVVPVPLHQDRLSARGYNQSLKIATGICQITGHRIGDVLRREHATKTQTRLSRWERFENTVNEFRLANADLIKNRRVLLLDDIITTGATIVGCAMPLVQGGVDKLIVASVGLTQEL